MGKKIPKGRRRGELLVEIKKRIRLEGITVLQWVKKGGNHGTGTTPIVWKERKTRREAWVTSEVSHIENGH